MRLAFLCLAFFSCTTAVAQVRYDHELQLTETRFALESQIHGLKWGFLHNMDTGALGIGKDGFVNLHTVWTSRPDVSNFLLQWKPSALWWSDDGLFGLTTGPFFTQAARDSAVMATGYFFTVWKRNKLTEPFRFVVDAGLPMSKPREVAGFAGMPVTKEVIHAKTKAKGGTFALNRDTADRSLPFKTQSSQGSLMKALNKFSDERGILIFSDHGKVNYRALDKVGFLQGKYHFHPAGTKELSGGCFYEWGQLREALGSKEDPVTGFYLHVWQMVGDTPRLLAAVHRFDKGQ